MSHWDKMDKKVWQESEVMQEFEKIITKSIIEIQKKVEAQQQAQEISRKLDTINKSVENTSKGLNTFLDNAKNLAKDNVEEDIGYVEPEVLPPTEAEQAEAKMALLEELNELAMQASNQGNYKLAYKIERSIDSILFEE